MQVKAIAVFCGSKSGVNPIFVADAEQLGALLASKEINLIYGGGNKGLMGAVANGALSKGGKVTGIIPKALTEFEHQHEGLTELNIVDTMHIRKQLLYDKCDAAIILPGGYGTLDEVFEMLTWNQLSIHHRPIYFMNSGGFYNHLLSHIQVMEEEGLLYGNPTDLITVVNEVEAFNDLLKGPNESTE